MGIGWGNKRKKHRGKPSHTPGKLKGENCKASPMDRFYAKRSRSYKSKGYATWCRKSEKLVYGSTYRR